MNNTNRSRLMFVSSMIIFGTIGIFRRYVSVPSGMIAMSRGFIGMLFLIGIMLIKREKLSLQSLKKNAGMLFLSGAVMGFNWILLFEAYKYTTVAVATLCYYMAPLFVIAVSPFLFKERLTILKCGCMIAAIVGMVLVSNMSGGEVSAVNNGVGILLGLSAAVLYALVMLLNKKIVGVKAFDKTIFQLGAAGIVLLPYTLIAEGSASIEFTTVSIVMLLVMGVIHTGVAYAMYFSSIEKIKAQTAAMLSYIDPVIAVLLSVLILGENMGIMGYAGAVLILGAAILCDRE